MATIEERAKLAQTQMPNTSSPYVMFREGYLKGATEQKEIDDEHTILCLKEQRKAITDSVLKALDGIYFANEDARKEAKDILKKVIERKRKEE